MGNKPKPPVIIIGMHRSGTSMLARMLEELGLFVGKKKEGNHEAIFFLKINDWLLRQSGGSWDNPEPVEYLINNSEVRALAVDYINYLMKTPRVINYLGWGKYICYRSPVNLDIPWGWKDPRNAYTLPLWLDLFPDAKVIHIYRHGVDVANSLKVRAEKSLSNSMYLHPKRKHLYWIRPKKGGFVETLRCMALEGGFSLWENYLKQANYYVETLGSNALEMKYEDFLDSPGSALQKIVDFCDLEVDNEKIDIVSSSARKGRAYAYKDNDELNIFKKQVEERMRPFGY